MKADTKSMIGSWHLLDDWHEDYGPCVFARFDEGGWPELYFGSPMDSGWSHGIFTHCTPLPDPPSQH
jgi:hypothetical protein